MTRGNVGDPVAATDFNHTDDSPDLRTYTLGGDDADSFSINRETGQIAVGSGTKLDYETKDTYTVEVTATDSYGASATIMVTITVTDVNEAPTISRGGLAISGNSNPSYAEDRSDAVETYRASGPESANAMWTLSGDDAGDFSISSGGMLTFSSSPDYENPTDMGMDNTYMVTIMADDGTYMAMRNVTVTVTNEDELGMLVGQDSVGYMENDTVAVETYTADGPVTPTWSVEGDDMEAFTIGGSSGELMFASPPDFEAPADMGMDNMYQVTVKATDAGGEMDMMDVTVTVTNVEEPGMVTLWASTTEALTMAPQVGDTITGAVMDPDGNPGDMPPIAMDTTIDDVTWQWSRTADDMDSRDMDSWMPIEDATDAAYMVTEGDTGYYLRVMATYTDAAGTDMGHSPATMMVGALEISGMSSVDYAENGMDAVATYMAAGPNADMATWSLEGDDSGAFTIGGSSGELMFASPPDFEAPADMGMDNMYQVTVKATDAGGEMDMMDVTVTVTNVEEPGMVTLWASTTEALTMAPQVGDTITGAVMDPDGNPGDMPPIAMDTTIDDVTWQWSRTADDMDSRDMDSWMPIEDATDAAYMVTEGDTGYYLRVMATYTDAAGTDMGHSPATMMVGALEISGMSSVDYAENGMDAVATYMAAGPNADMATWSLEGDDSGAFTIGGSSGELMFASPPDFEAPADMGMDNMYQVTVKATDAGGEMDMMDVTVTVTNVDEDGTVTLSSMQPVVDTMLTATLDDLDGGITGTTWQWASSGSNADDATWTNIDGATMASYTPVEADVGMYLQATASYTDGEGAGKTAMAVSANTVAAEGAGDIVSQYDTDGTPGISRTEAVAAVLDYLIRGDISRDEAIQVVRAYLLNR